PTSSAASDVYKRQDKSRNINKNDNPRFIDVVNLLKTPFLIDKRSVSKQIELLTTQRQSCRDH
ncbi:hypothetical protein KQJ29_34790, partial [Enterococcus sp. S181_ASV_20]|nr:hypothetical protein [Enterococcus sp. S181_ASV_20]